MRTKWNDAKIGVRHYSKDAEDCVHLSHALSFCLLSLLVIFWASRSEVMFSINSLSR